MKVSLTKHSSASKPIRQTSYVRRQATAIRKHLAKHGTPGVTDDFFVWVNRQLVRQGARVIKLPEE